MSSFYGNGSAKGGGGGGTSDYNALNNKPIINLTGITPIDFSALPEDVYNIKGNYKYSADGETYTWLSANLVYVSKDTLTDNKIVHFDVYENDKRYSITIIYSDDDYKVEKFAYDVMVSKQDKEELPEVGDAGSIYSTEEGVFVYVNGDYRQLGTSDDYNWEPIEK